MPIYGHIPSKKGRIRHILLLRRYMYLIECITMDISKPYPCIKFGGRAIFPHSDLIHCAELSCQSQTIDIIVYFAHSLNCFSFLLSQAVAYKLQVTRVLTF